ncbi:MAG: hypothetical protein HY370_08635 [Proteobacteria bacterium]|nr:hypothetical protein [Pseudomonadota bacterium]
MNKRHLKYFTRTVVIVAECVGALLSVALLATIFLVLRLLSGPLDVGFAKKYIEQALRDPVSGYSVTLDGATMHWPDMDGPLMLRFNQVGLIKRSKEVLAVRSVQVGLSGIHLLAGRIEPVRIILRGPALHLVRMQDGRINLSVDDDPGDDDIEETAENPLMRIINTLSGPESGIDRRSPIGHLQSVEIGDANMVMEDHILGISWYLTGLDLMFARERRGLAVTAGVQIPGGRNGAASLSAAAVYNRVPGDFDVRLNIKDFNPRVLSRKIEDLSFLESFDLSIDGTMRAKLDASLKLQSAEMALSADDGYLDIQGVYDAPFPFQKIFLDVAYDAAAGRADVRSLSLRAQDVDVLASSAIAVGENDISASVKISVPQLPQEKVKALWPDALRGKSIESWMTQQLSDGIVNDISVAFDLSAVHGEERWDTKIENIVSSFGISGMTVDYRAPLKAARDVKGAGRYENDILTVEIESAAVGPDLSVTGGKVTIDNIAGDAVGTANIDVKLTGPLPSVFDYISDEPIDMKGEDLGLDSENIKGKADLDVNINFPTLKELPAEKVKVTASGRLSDVVLPDVVKTLDLTGGPLDLRVAGGKVELKGKAKIEGRDIILSWEQFLETEGKPYGSKIVADVNADKGLRDLLGIALDDWMQGAVHAHVIYTEFGGGRSEADVTADVKPALITVKPFAHEKPAGAAGTVRCVAVLQKGQLREIKNFSIDAPDMKLSNGTLKFDAVGGRDVLRSGIMPQFSLGETNGSLDFTIAPNGAFRTTLKGKFLDARPFLKKKKEKREPYNGPPVVASVDVMRMRTADQQTVDRAKIYLDLSGEGLPNQLELDAVAGRGAIYFRLKPDAAGRVNFRMEADDAGATLRAFEIYKNVRGGKIVMEGASAPGKNARVIFGNAQLSDFNVVDAPVLAQLIGAISPTGLPQLLSGEGLYFSRLESKFEWYMRKPGDIYAITDGRTSGSSLGLTFEGKIDKERNAIDMKGHIVPVSEINSLLSDIPLIGDILTGGNGGGIFAATYTVEGPTEKPDVSVNPLSVLAPGILRRMLFEDE